MKKLNKKGFTLAELLIVVAIIAVLVAIAIPVFSSQLEKAREATDAANLRAAYAEVVATELEGETVTPITVTQNQKKAAWQSTISWPSNITEPEVTSTAGSWTVSWNAAANNNAGAVTITYTAA